MVVGPADTFPLRVPAWAADVRAFPSWAVDARAPASWAVDARASPSGVLEMAGSGPLPRTTRRRPQPGPGSRPPRTGDHRRGSPPCHARTPHRHRTWGPLQPSIVPAQPPSPGVPTDWGPGTTTSCTTAVVVAASPSPFLFFLPPFLFFLPSFLFTLLFSTHKKTEKKTKSCSTLFCSTSSGLSPRGAGDPTLDTTCGSDDEWLTSGRSRNKNKKGRDICSTVEHGCEQLCVNTDGSYICKCLERYTLSEDGKRCKRCADGVIDLVFVIDGSKSLGPDNFELVKQFVKGIIDSLDISPTTTRVGLLQYSTKVRSEFTLAQFSSVKDVNVAVSQIKYMGRGSMTGNALKHMLETSFTEAEGARPASVPKVTIVFTDGRSQDDVSEWSTKAQKNGITMYAVGVGKAIEDELRQIASKPQNKHLYYAEDFSKMGEIADKLKSRICEEKPSLEDQCKCENVIDFQNQANEQMRKLTQRLAVMSRKVEALENRLGYK